MFLEHLILSFQDGDILHNAYMEFITKILSVFILIHIKSHILKPNSLRFALVQNVL